MSTGRCGANLEHLGWIRPIGASGGKVLFDALKVKPFKQSTPKFKTFVWPRGASGSARSFEPGKARNGIGNACRVAAHSSRTGPP